MAEAWVEYSHELSVTAMVSLGTDFLTSSPTIPRYVAPSRICTRSGVRREAHGWHGRCDDVAT